tara:strand:+ start:267 stop:686 length:420 start_codon:yes stop_codon:yes gene_type:complete
VAKDDTNLNSEFLVFGFSIEKITAIYGGILIFWGLAVTFISGSTSITSYIPSMFGWPMLFLGVMALKAPKYKKILMHIVVVIGLLIFLGGLDVVRNIMSGTFGDNPWASASKTMLLVTGAYFSVLCVKSFIHARKMRSE